MNIFTEKKTSFFIFLFFSIIAVCIIQKLIYEPDIKMPHSDAFWYIDYSLGLKEHHTFGYSGTQYTPSNVITPLYPAYLSLILSVDNKLKNDFICLLHKKNNTKECNANLSNLAWYQSILVIITLCSIWLIAIETSNSIKIAWLSSTITLLMGRLMNFSNLILTEALTIMLFSVFTFTLIKFINKKRLIWLSASALFLALLTLTRPQFHYLFISILLLQALLFLINRSWIKFNYLIITIITYYCIVGPWIIRNHYHFDNTALTSGYGDRVLITRVSYNRMSWKEWGTSFIYWFPDSGDSIAKKMFPKEYYEKLSFDAGSYYRDDSDVLPELIKTKSTDEKIDYLLKHEILGNIYKHSVVTIVLIWRGMFIAKYWGVLGFICFLFMLLKHKKPEHRKLILISLPAWFIVFFHAFFSLNIARYNLILTPLYSISMATIGLYLYISFKEKYIDRTENR